MNVTYNVGRVMCDSSLKAEFPIYFLNKIKKGGQVLKKKVIFENRSILDFSRKKKKSPFFQLFPENGNGSKKKSIIVTAFMLHKLVYNCQFNRINNSVKFKQIQGPYNGLTPVIQYTYE